MTNIAILIILRAITRERERLQSRKEAKNDTKNEVKRVRAITSEDVIEKNTIFL